LIVLCDLPHNTNKFTLPVEILWCGVFICSDRQNSMTYEILHLSKLHKQFSIKTVLEDANLHINRGERYALVGENGIGKSTLARIVIGQESADSGKIRFAPNAITGYLPQEIDQSGSLTIAQYIAECVGDLYVIEQRMRTLETQLTDTNRLAEYGELQEKFITRGGYDLPHRIERVFAGLGIQYLNTDRLVSSLSGGEKTRVHIAGLLLKEPDLLILDEPTNHLDFAGIEWLENYLEKYPHALLLITHDRTFIDKVATHIVELSAKTHQLKTYVGNYAEFLRLKQTELERAIAEFEAQRNELQRLKRLAKTIVHNTKTNIQASDGDKMGADFHKGNAEVGRGKAIADAKQRIIVLENNKLENPNHQWRIEFQFNPHPLMSAVPLQFKRLSLRYGDKIILDHTEGVIQRGERVVLVAPNGTGKTSLLRLLSGMLSPDNGMIQFAPSVRLGFLDQEGETLNQHQRAIESYQAVLDTPLPEREVLAELHRSGLFSDTTLPMKRVSELSVGQRRKLGIARLIASRANLLLLDEPTNHLDLQSIEALEDALLNFRGTILAVSHDRRFIDKVAMRVWHLQDGKIHG
jgi:macrolide transport system ATP-binding/permease protein